MKTRNEICNELRSYATNPEAETWVYDPDEKRFVSLGNLPSRPTIKLKEGDRRLLGMAITYGDITDNQLGWAARTGIPNHVIGGRLKAGWTVGETLGFEPRISRKGRRPKNRQ